MKFNLVNAVAAGAVVSLAIASTASAQQQTSLTANVPGVCLLSSSGLIAGSSVGKSVDARLKQLGSQVQAELQPEATSLDTEQKAIEAAAKAANGQITPALQQRADAFQQRAQVFQQKQRLRSAELQQTEQKALGRVGEAAKPVIHQVALQKNCGIVVEAASVIDANSSMDITPAAISALDAKLPSISFDREVIPTNGGGQ